MGTNYYFRHNCCEYCERYDELHIGKSSLGWTFSFRGHKELGINSWKDWQEFIENNEGDIFDEYGSPASLESLRNLVEVKRDGRNHSVEYPDGHYLDLEGHSFSYHGFS